MLPWDTLRLAFRALVGSEDEKRIDYCRHHNQSSLHIAFSLFFPIGMAMMVGLYAAWRASRMNVVAALKYQWVPGIEAVH